MPGFGAQASVDDDGTVDCRACRLTAKVLGFGRKDNLQALEEAESVAGRKVDEAEENAKSPHRVAGA